ncbi:MAG TPA: nucleoside kinase, partial [bacterium]|nr:nucleoside kinase [bacterium]
NSNRIFTSDSRLIRRIVRDKLYRSYTAADTIHRWDSVREGERRNIFPFQEKADAFFNSSLIYEPAVLKDFAERFLLEVKPDQRAYVEAQRLLEFLSIFVPIPAREAPNTSILREFIGGSTFNY